MVTQNEYSHPWKALQKRTRSALFSCRKSESRTVDTIKIAYPIQPSATHPPFWQTCLFTIFPKLWTTIRGWNNWENREKAGLSKRGIRLFQSGVAIYAPQTKIVDGRTNIREPMWETNLREIATPDWVRTLRRFHHTHQYVMLVNWPTQSGVAISRKCCFPHGRERIFKALFKGVSQYGHSH